MTEELRSEFLKACRQAWLLQLAACFGLPIEIIAARLQSVGPFLSDGVRS